MLSSLLSHGASSEAVCVHWGCIYRSLFVSPPMGSSHWEGYLLKNSVVVQSSFHERIDCYRASSRFDSFSRWWIRRCSRGRLNTRAIQTTIQCWIWLGANAKRITGIARRSAKTAFKVNRNSRNACQIVRVWSRRSKVVMPSIFTVSSISLRALTLNAISEYKTNPPVVKQTKVW
jgi:hypothetical protein